MKLSSEDINRFFPKPWKTRKLDDVDGFELAYLRGEPFFHSGESFFTKSIQLRFLRALTQEESFYTLSLEKAEEGWQVFLKEPHVLVEGVGLVQPNDIGQLVNALNESLRSGLEVDTKKLMKQWDVYEYSYCRNTFLPLVAENIDMLPENYAPNDILLTYQNGRPVFFQDNTVGHRVETKVGECYRDDNFYETMSFYIIVKPDWKGAYLVTWGKQDVESDARWYDASGWLDDQGIGQADWEVLKAHYSEPDKAFAEVVNQCNLAIQRGETFNFGEFMDYLLRWDKTANLLLNTTTLYF